jgi:hypothetical protein
VQSRETLNPAHDRHDRVLVARYAAGDAYQSEVDKARSLVDGCTECAALAADIRLISSRTAQLQPIRRTRDFRISAEQAEQLRGTWLDRFFRTISTPGWTVVRPLAGAALAVGIVLAGVGALPISGIAPGGASSALAPTHVLASQGAAATAPTVAQLPQPTPAEFDTSASAPPPEAGGTSIPGTISSAPMSTQPDASEYGSDRASTTPNVGVLSTPPAPPKANETPAPAPASPVAVVIVASPAASIAPPAAALVWHATVPVTNETSLDRSTLLVVGIGLALASLLALAVVWIARRRYSDPLVR